MHGEVSLASTAVSSKTLNIYVYKPSDTHAIDGEDPQPGYPEAAIL